MTVADGESTDEDADRVEFCGYKSPPDFVSSTRNLHIMLKQELQPHGKGMAANYVDFRRSWTCFNLKWNLQLN